MNETEKAIQASIRQEQEGNGGCVKNVPSETTKIVEQTSAAKWWLFMIALEGGRGGHV